MRPDLGCVRNMPPTESELSVFICTSENSTKYSPEIVVHRLEKELVVGPVQHILEIGQRHLLRRYRYFHQIRRLLVVYVIYHLRLVHFRLIPQRKSREISHLTTPTHLQHNMADMFAAIPTTGVKPTLRGAGSNKIPDD